MTKPAYMVICIDVHDAAGMEPYAASAMPVLDAFGAVVLAATNNTKLDDGTWPRSRAVLIEFPSMDQAHAFWTSEDYEPLKAMRNAASNADIILIEGMFDERLQFDEAATPHYLLGAATVTDPSWVEEYMQKVPPVSAKFGVRAVASGAEFEVLEGGWPHTSAVLLGFPSEQVFTDFWYGEEYRPMKELREANSTGGHISFAGGLE